MSTRSDHLFVGGWAKGLADRGFRVARFEFPYTAALGTEKKRPPDPEPVLRAAWLQGIAEFGPDRLVIGGKSMGGRIARLIADDAKVACLVCLCCPHVRTTCCYCWSAIFLASPPAGE